MAWRMTRRCKQACPLLPYGFFGTAVRGALPLEPPEEPPLDGVDEAPDPLDPGLVEERGVAVVPLPSCVYPCPFTAWTRG